MIKLQIALPHPLLLLIICICAFPASPLTASSLTLPALTASASRQTLSLDGEWQVGEGTMNTPPQRFDRTCPVPGLLDQATPPYEHIGTSSTLREAFWYRRTLQIDGPVPARATLKINKAAYNTRVLVNDRLAGDHVGPFTPGYFDVAPLLHGNGGPNELLVRVGADLSRLPPDSPDGHDFEKIIYQPGIYDSVSLTLSGAPWIDRVQIVPDLVTSTARCVVDLNGTTNTATITAIVREAKTRREVARTSAQVTAGAHRIELSPSIPHPHLWSPEDPFLYEAEISSGADTYTTRFGLRSFALDHASGRVLLNGQPYFMRGTNVCIFRFFEDAERLNRPWDREWVRLLHQRFRGMNWNSMRYCIGFPPEFWYDIADEEGLLIQDEFPIWGWFGRQPRFTPDSVGAQYREWLPEHWNHPSVAIWDGQNETVTTITAQAIQQVRSMDLSNRPWDNGWGIGRDTTDSLECHPYVFIDPRARLSTLSAVDEGYAGTPEPVTGNPMILNEYGWLWINRDGSPCKLTTKLYENLLGTTATAEARRTTYARYEAELTEFWRTQRRFAAVMHFCGLSYCRPGGQTSDNFIDIGALKFEPNFEQYVGDAFSTAGICIDDYRETWVAEEPQEIPVSVINDYPQPVSGTVALSLILQGKEAETTTAQIAVDGLGKSLVRFALRHALQPGASQLHAELRIPQQRPVSSWRDIQVISREQAGLAYKARAVASSTLSRSGKRGMQFRPEYAVDAQEGTRWASDDTDNEWLALELPKAMAIKRVDLLWENACALEFALETSNDGTSWTEVFHERNGKPGPQSIKLNVPEAKWIRMRGIKRATRFGYSLYEVRVF